MKKIFKKLDWWFDYYFAWMLYNGNKTHRYIEYMEKKWGKDASTEHLREK